MMKKTFIATILLFSSTLFAQPVIENAQVCSMKDLSVACENGENIHLDVIRNKDNRGDIFLNINTKEKIGTYLLLYIDSQKPDVLKVENGKNAAKGAFLTRSIILKLRSANSVQFKIGMQKRNPISGKLDQNHFEWLKKFGKACS